MRSTISNGASGRNSAIGGLDDAGDLGGRGTKHRAPLGDGDDRRHGEVADRDPERLEDPDDPDAGRLRVEGDLLGGLAQRGGRRVPVLRLGLAAREADLTRVVAAAARPFDEDDPGEAVGIGVEQGQDGGGPPGQGRRHRAAPDATRAGRRRPA